MFKFGQKYDDHKKTGWLAFQQLVFLPNEFLACETDDCEINPLCFQNFSSLLSGTLRWGQLALITNNKTCLWHGSFLSCLNNQRLSVLNSEYGSDELQKANEYMFLIRTRIWI